MSVCEKTSADHRWVEIGTCSHGARFGEALECVECGKFAHRWEGFACGRRRQTRAEFDAQARLCPIAQRQRGEMPAPAAEGAQP